MKCPPTTVRLLIALGSLASMLALGACSDEDDSACAPTNASELSQALTECSNVSLEGRQFAGNFSVSAGTTIEGGGATITGTGEGAALRLSGGTAPIRLSNLQVFNNGVAILATEGEVVIEGVSVQVERGLGVIAENTTSLTVRNSTFTGPVNDALLPDLGERLDANEVAIAGLLVKGGEAALEDVEISGFAGFGAIFYQTVGRWVGGSVHDYVGSGVLVEQSDVEMESVTIEDGKRGQRIGFSILTQGITVSSDAQLRTIGVQIQRIDGLGLLQDNATSNHLDLVVQDNRDAGLWIQNAPGSAEVPAISITGAASLISGNRGAGLFLREVGGVVLDGVEIANTGLAPHDQGPTPLDIGDGIQLTGASHGIVLANSTLRDNARIGMLIDGTDNDAFGSASFQLDEVAIEASAEGALGLIVQNGADVDTSGVSVDPTLAERDAAQMNAVPVVDTLDIVFGTGDSLDNGAVGGIVNDDGSVGLFGFVTESGLGGG